MFNTFIAYVRVQFQAQACQIQIDNEALKESFKETIKDRGIIILKSPPNSSKPNGVAERAGG